uniref:NnrU domain-containing protein n=1 Tax=Chromera velia CCMP2878 TaxID=1169474 RepID=A0A0G4HYZ5_9ALVE|mmetsp:Transcript_47804/g.94338  ORF Transcript_47804/g.94338 Transcript_47804/m.94338 type:complete len:384 (+) Transcript_47804:82-1233(+)|eukprot:Cvel_9613.t1-p1 / transcript=Cvel_9613.t1 / gene=Cvel_9613 / organism=Chromera_velia_CCMP2878 / gene_product=15-cis-zeta-carotene isomerase, chloroplastic, putative / transcript_product=15-cis-zeta-carotene isomerase, chloroplastic, putative / location=Cvel_scaffold558:67424-71034(-) / protein_length=383 / sequence_SO=supercontig / SO=protein_coding / is_pseudo=false
MTRLVSLFGTLPSLLVVLFCPCTVEGFRAVGPSAFRLKRSSTCPQRRHIGLDIELEIPGDANKGVLSEQSLTSPVTSLSSETLKTSVEDTGLVGEDAATFSLAEQSLKSWALFGVLVSIVLGGIYLVWFNEEIGLGLGSKYLELLGGGTDAPELVITKLLGVFALVHSGGASLRPLAEPLIGKRAWRVIFALLSLPLGASAIVFWINHRYEGVELWNLKNVPGLHDFCWVLSLVSFLFLYPSTFNLLEVAAVDEPELHLWETGVIRITRHPQAFGQALWCLAHCLWIGTSMTLWTSFLLVAHHVFGCWNGDRRLRDKWGDKFELVKERTSVVPFAALLEGRQELPPDYWKEWLRVPYAIVIGGSLGAYLAHPYMQAGSWQTGW